MQFVPCTFAQPLECKQGRIGESYSRSPLRKETYSQLDGMADTYLSSPHAWVVHTSFSPPDRAGEDDRRPWGPPVAKGRLIGGWGSGIIEAGEYQILFNGSCALNDVFYYLIAQQW